MKKLWLAVVFLMLGLSSNAYSMQYTLIPIDYPGAVSTNAYGINNKGDIVGSYYDGTTSHGYVYNGENFTTVNFPGAVETSLRNINDSGKVVGWYNFDGAGFYNTYGFVYDGRAYTSIAFPEYYGFLPQETSMNGINNSDTIVGGYWLGDVFGFAYEKGVVTKDFYGYGEDINDDGIIVAHNVEPGPWSWLVIDDKQIPFKGSENVHEINAYGINNLGYVVGEYAHDDYGWDNFVHDGEKFNQVDLPGIIRDINDQGQIVGNRYLNGTGYAYIATPTKGVAVPEPSLVLLLGTALAGLFSMKYFLKIDSIQ